MSSPSRREAALSAALAFLPLLLDWLYKALIHPRPFWAFYYDPETIYLYDGLRLLRGQIPVNTDNPATAVQLVSALILAPLPRSPFAIDAFRSAGYVVALVLNAAAIYLLMRTVLRETPPLVRIAAIWGFLAFPAVLEYNTVWSPDTLYLAAGSIGLAGAWTYFRAPSLRHATLFGAAVGFCIALKFTFLVWIAAMLVAFALLKAWRDAVTALAACACAFVVTTAPVITRYPVMFRLITRMFLHRGAYGSVLETSVATPAEIVAGVARFVTAFWAWHVWALILIVVTLVVAIRGRIGRSGWALIVFALIAFLLPYVAASRQMSPRYVIPAGLVSILLVAIAGAEMKMTRPQQLVAVAAATAVLGVMWRADVNTHDLRNQNAVRLNAAVRWVIGARGVHDPVVVYSWRFPAPAYALRVLAPDDDCLRVIERRFPREGDYNPFSKRLRLPANAARWDFFVIAPQDVAASPAADAVLVARVGNFLVMRRR